jgi:hypothetical protein
MKKDIDISDDEKVYRAIRGHKEKLARFSETLDAIDRAGGKPSKQLRRSEHAHSREEIDAIWNVVTCVPRTLAGLRALVQYTVEQKSLHDFLGDDDVRRMLLTSIDESISMIIGAPSLFDLSEKAKARKRAA